MNRAFLMMSILIVFLVSFQPLAAQIIAIDDLEAVPIHKNERGFSFSLASTGIGLGGFYRWALPSFLHLGASLEFFAVRDDKELELISVFGYPYKINDANRLFTIPANIELKKRLFSASIEDNFRPHLMLQVGAIYGMNWPKEVFVNGVRFQPANEFQLTYNLLFGFGIDFTTRETFFATIRPQYRLIFFPEVIAGKTNHSVFEIKFEIGGQR